MSLDIDINIGYKLTTVFKFTTTLTGDNIFIDYGDGVAEVIDGESEHTYSDYGIYIASIIDCGNSVVGTQKIIVKPHIEDSVAIEAQSDETPVGKLSEKFYVEVCSNCPPPIKLKLGIVNSKTPFESKLTNDYKKDVTPKKYFVSNNLVGDDKIILTEDDVSEVNINGDVCGYKGAFFFQYYDDYPSEQEVCVTLERGCGLCDEKLRYHTILDGYCFGEYEECFLEYLNTN